MIVLAGQRDFVPDDSWDTGGRQRVIQAVLESLDRGPRLTQARESTPAYPESGV